MPHSAINIAVNFAAILLGFSIFYFIISCIFPKLRSKAIKICPKCGSTRIFISQQHSLLMSSTTPQYTCSSCGYTSVLFPEKKLEER